MRPNLKLIRDDGMDHPVEPARRRGNVYNPQEVTYNDANGGAADMDLEKYIDRLDQDRRETEARIREEQKAMEQRRIEEQKAMELRRAEERKEFREEMASMRLEMREGFNRLDSRIEGLRWWILGVCITTIVGIAAMVITVVVSN